MNRRRFLELVIAATSVSFVPAIASGLIPRQLQARGFSVKTGIAPADFITAGECRALCREWFENVDRSKFSDDPDLAMIQVRADLEQTFLDRFAGRRLYRVSPPVELEVDIDLPGKLTPIEKSIRISFK